MNLEDIWAKVLDNFKSTVSPLSFNVLFNNSKIVKIENNVVTIQVPMEYQKKKLLDFEYKQLIKDSIEEVLEESIDDINCVLESENVKVDDSTNQNEGSKKKKEVVEEKFESNLKKELNFDNFVVGESNKFAKTAALGIAQNPGVGYNNPLFLYGRSGLGKTHLMHAIGNYINEHNKDLKVLYTTSDEFRKDYTGIANSTDKTKDYAEEFKNKYRNIDVLIIDDIQYLVSAPKTQDEFFHTFSYLHDRKKQIIISSDRSPDDLKLLEERLRSRFSWGLPVDIYPPDFELRCRIIRNKISKYPTIEDKMTEEAIEFIANNCDSDVRAIEGAINRLAAFTAMCIPDKITLDFANEALKDYITSNPYNTNDIVSIQKAVADYYKLTIDVLKGKRRTADIAYPRMIAMYLCRMLTDQSFPRIGLEFGGRDHSTVIHAVDKIEEDLKTDVELKDIINEIKSKL